MDTLSSMRASPAAKRIVERLRDEISNEKAWSIAEEELEIAREEAIREYNLKAKIDGYDKADPGYDEAGDDATED